MTEKPRIPQHEAAVFYDPQGLFVGVQTHDGHSVLMTPEIAEAVAKELVASANTIRAITFARNNVRALNRQRL